MRARASPFARAPQARSPPALVGYRRSSKGATRVIAAIDDAALVKKILAHLGLTTERPPISPARAPPQLDFDDELEVYEVNDIELVAT